MKKTHSSAQELREVKNLALDIFEEDFGHRNPDTEQLSRCMGLAEIELEEMRKNG